MPTPSDRLALSRLYANPDLVKRSVREPFLSFTRVLYALGFIAALAFFGSLAGALLNKGISGRSAEPSRFVRLSVSLLIASNIVLAGVGGATPAGEAERGVGLAIRGPDEGGGLGVRKLTTFPVSGHEAFYNKISIKGNAKMSRGDEVVAAEGVYKCGTCDNIGRMYWIYDLNGVIRCESDLECKLDGEESRRVMVVDSTPGGTLSLRRFHIHRGSYNLGGGIYTQSANIILTTVRFTQCQATYGSDSYGGGAIYAYSGTISLYAVEFSGNSAASNQGDDIYTPNAAVIIHSTCPEGEGGSPTEGERLPCPLAPRHFPTNYPLTPSPLHRHTTSSEAALDTYMEPGQSGTFTGPTNSYNKGTCAVCTPGTFLNSETNICDSCPGGKYTDGDGLGECSSCPAGSFDSSTGGSTSTDCALCAAGKFAEDPGQTSCEECGIGKVSEARLQWSFTFTANMLTPHYPPCPLHLPAPPLSSELRPELPSGPTV